MQQCPEFFSPFNGACVYDCSQHSMFRLLTANGQAKCEYRYDPTMTVPLIPQNAIPVAASTTGATIAPVPTLAQLDTSSPTHAGRYRTELNRVDGAVNALLAQLDSKQQERDAFEALQMAEAVRDSDPIAYQMARNTYYTLTKGEEWLNSERARILAADVEPELARYRGDYLTASQQKTGQQRTLDIVESVKDRVLSLKDDFQYSTSMFKKQIDGLKSQVNIERRGRDAQTINQDTVTFYSWLEVLLNLTLVIVGLYGALTLWSVSKTYWKTEAPAAYSVGVKSP